VATLHLIVALPCSGKTTVARQLETHYSAVHLDRISGTTRWDLTKLSMIPDMLEWNLSCGIWRPGASVLDSGAAGLHLRAVGPTGCPSGAAMGRQGPDSWPRTGSPSTWSRPPASAATGSLPRSPCARASISSGTSSTCTDCQSACVCQGDTPSQVRPSGRPQCDCCSPDRQPRWPLGHHQQRARRRLQQPVDLDADDRPPRSRRRR
jgi:hypothetical protein